MTLRIFRILHLALTTALLITACGPLTPVADFTPQPNTSAAPTFTPLPTISVDPRALKDLRIQAWHAFSGTSAQAFTSALARFNSTNKWGITVIQTGQGDHPSMFAAVDASLASGSPPDLVAALPEQVLVWDASAAVVDLNAYISDPNWGFETRDFSAVFWQQDEVDGHRLGVPAERSARYLFYNVTWAHELGFDRPPATNDEFREQACAANASFRLDADEQDDGYGGWIVDASWGTIYPWMLSFGGSVTDDDDYRFRNDQNLSTLEFLKTLKDDGCAWMVSDPQIAFALNPGPFYEQFSHRLALFITGDLTEASRFSAELARFSSADEWTMIPFPGSQTQTVTVYGPSYTLFKTTPERQLAAWLFVRWVLASENQADWVEATGTLPLRTSARDLLDSYRLAHPQWDAAVQALPLAQGVPQIASWRTVRYVLEDGTLSIFRKNVPLTEIPNVLTEMDATVQELNK